MSLITFIKWKMATVTSRVRCWNSFPSAMTLNCDATSLVALKVRMRQTLRYC